MGINWKKVWINLLAVVLFLCIPILTSPDFDYSFNLFSVKPFLRNFSGYLFIIICFYIHYYLLLPRFFARKKIVLYLASVVALYLLLFALQSVFFHPAYNMMPPMPVSFRHPGPPMIPEVLAPGSVVPFVVMILFSIVLYLNQKTKQIELDKYQIELHNLKYQLQPHFLFNTLNNLYSISILEPEKTPKYILKLSDILRHILLNDTSELVPLKDDLKFCQEYISLQSLRFEKTDDWMIEFPENTEKLVISPFILIPVIENVFKYGIHPDKPSPIEIILSVEQNTLLLKTWNNKHFTNTNSLLSSEKIGLTKTKERLQLIYPGAHKLTILDSEESFEVQLSIQLKHV